MKVKQLKKLLEKADDNAIVVLSSDGEGNNFSELSDSNISGGYYFNEEYREIREKSELDDDTKGYKPCIVFWPV